MSYTKFYRLLELISFSEVVLILIGEGEEEDGGLCLGSSIAEGLKKMCGRSNFGRKGRGGR